MGKGDTRTAKGKRFIGSFGNIRPKAKNKKNSKKTDKK
jgi:ribosomal small subunit protein bTHX